MKSVSSSSSSKFLSNALAAALFAAVALTSGACSKDKKADDGAVPTAMDADSNAMLGDSDSGRAMGLQTVNFPYDSHELSGQSKTILRANAQVLKDRPSMNIQVEGHCDERGGIQYNIALGERRANSVRRYLMDLGVSGDRVTTVSFGKERPLIPGSDEESWAKNRRANFVVTSQ